jgi:hypothetical protein
MAEDPNELPDEPNAPSHDLADERRFAKILLFTAPAGVATVAALGIATVFDIPVIWHFICFGLAVLFGILTCVGLYRLLGAMDRVPNRRH